MQNKDTCITKNSHANRWRRIRLLHIGILFLLIHMAISAKLIHLGISSSEYNTQSKEQKRKLISLNRPDLVDRNGELLAIDIKAFSLYAEPRHIPHTNVKGIMDKLSQIDTKIQQNRSVYRNLSGSGGFVWLKRRLSGEKYQKIFSLGIPGLGFIKENRRFYPGGGLAAHILGYVNIDNHGLAGIEKYIDTNNKLIERQKLQVASKNHNEYARIQRLALDIRVQHVIRDELSRAMKLYKAKTSVGIMLNAHTGEVLAMVSLPDFDINTPGKFFADEKYMNRATASIYEMGSIFKIFNTAMAIDAGKTKLGKLYTTSRSIQVGHHSIREFRHRKSPLTMQEIFIYSSNTGAVLMALEAGATTQRSFFAKVGLLDRLDTELPELRIPRYHSKQNDIYTATMSFGHGIAVSPMHVVAAAAATVNGGFYLPPTFFPRSYLEARTIARRVLKKSTSDTMLLLFRLCVEQGSCKKAESVGYHVGGKTGTAEKLKDGKYVKESNFNSFLAAFPSAFPIEQQRYILLIVLDEPINKETNVADLASNSCAITASRIISRTARMLGVKPMLNTSRLPPATELVSNYELLLDTPALPKRKNN